jgi:hypothetical protein
MIIITTPATDRKTPIPPCLGPPARNTATNSATQSNTKANREKLRPCTGGVIFSEAEEFIVGNKGS